MENKTYRVKAIQHSEEVQLESDGRFDCFIVPEMNHDGEEFIVWTSAGYTQWFRDGEWNYHKSWLIFLDDNDTVSNGDE